MNQLTSEILSVIITIELLIIVWFLLGYALDLILQLQGLHIKAIATCVRLNEIANETICLV
jgi:hypothetical protein